MPKRSPIRGYNHNINHRGLVFHVQTEDSGVDNPHVFTHLFHGGVILFTRRLDYDASSDKSVVKSLMQAQHKAVLKELKKGRFADKIEEYLGEHPDLKPRGSRDTVPPPDGLTDGARADSGGGADPSEASDTDPGPARDGVPTLISRTGQDSSGANNSNWPAPSQVSRSEISDVFRVITQPPPDLDEDDWAEDDSTEDDADPPPGLERRGPYGRLPARDTVEMTDNHVPGPNSAPIPGPTSGPNSGPTVGPPAGLIAPPDAPIPPGARTLRPRGPVPPPPPPPRGSAHVGRRGAGNVLVSQPPIRVDNRGPRTTPVATPPPPNSSGRRTMAPRTVREEKNPGSLFDQHTISEKSLDEVILAYLSEDAAKENS